MRADQALHKDDHSGNNRSRTKNTQTAAIAANQEEDGGTGGVLDVLLDVALIAYYYCTLFTSSIPSVR